MKKSDLRSGTIVQTRDGTKFIVLLNCWDYGLENDLIIDFLNGCYLRLSDYNESLFYKNHQFVGAFDIIRVCNLAYTGDNIFKHITQKKDVWTWERKTETKSQYEEYTIEQLEKLLGKNIKIKGETK